MLAPLEVSQRAQVLSSFLSKPPLLSEKLFDSSVEVEEYSVCPRTTLALEGDPCQLCEETPDKHRHPSITDLDLYITRCPQVERLEGFWILCGIPFWYANHRAEKLYTMGCRAHTLILEPQALSILRSLHTDVFRLLSQKPKTYSPEKLTRKYTLMREAEAWMLPFDQVAPKLVAYTTPSSHDELNYKLHETRITAAAMLVSEPKLIKIVCSDIREAVFTSLMISKMVWWEDFERILAELEVDELFSNRPVVLYVPRKIVPSKMPSAEEMLAFKEGKFC